MPCPRCPSRYPTLDSSPSLPTNLPVRLLDRLFAFLLSPSLLVVFTLPILFSLLFPTYILTHSYFFLHLLLLPILVTPRPKPYPNLIEGRTAEGSLRTSHHTHPNPLCCFTAYQLMFACDVPQETPSPSPPLINLVFLPFCLCFRTCDTY